MFRIKGSIVRNFGTIESFASPAPSTHQNKGRGAAQHSSPQNNSLKRFTQKRGKDMGKLNGKVAVITAATSGMALATAKLFVEEGAYVFITGRRQDKLDEAVKLIGKNVRACKAMPQALR